MIALPVDIPHVPFHSQLQEIQSPVWQQQGCGITSLAMIIDYYTNPDPISVNGLLQQAIKAGAYQPNAGWIHKGLVQLAQKYGLEGNTYDLSKSDSKSALATFSALLKDGPIIASVFYKFNPKSPLPHMVVIDGIENGMVYYNDPATRSGTKEISVADFVKGWKKKFIVIRDGKKDSVAIVPSDTILPVLAVYSPLTARLID